MIDAVDGADHPEDGHRSALLFVLDKDPLPATSGSRQRAVNLIRALTDCGDVDVYLVGEPADASRCAELERALGVRRVATTGRLPELRRRRPRLDALARPSRISSIDAGEVRARFGRDLPAPYDLVLFVGLPVWWTLHPVVCARVVVVDTENVMSVWAGRMARIEWARARSGALLRPRLRAIQRAVQQWLDVPRWRRLEARAAETAKVIVVCSPDDRRALGAPNAVVIPNGIDLPARPVGKDEVGVSPTLVFPGRMNYAPNLDGARFLVSEVLPELLEVQPDVRLILAGKAPASLHDLASAQVEVTGYVEHMEDVLARADAVVVPLRSGGGTRIKILEAWANRLPVVSTTIGAEGLDAQDGVDVLLADTPRDFARACRRIVSDRALRQALTERGRQRVEEEFDWTGVRRQMVMIVERLVGSSRHVE